MMDQNIRVVMLGSFPIDATRIWGGVQAAYLYLVKGLAKIQSVDVHVLTFRPHQYDGPEELRQGNFTIHLLDPFPRFERLRIYQTYQSNLERKLDQIRPDVIHVEDIGADAYVALRTGYPTVISIHGIRREDTKYVGAWNKQIRHYFDSAIIEKYNFAHARYLIAISSYVTDYYKNAFRSDANIYFIPNAVDERFFHLEAPPGENVILYAGRVIPRKYVKELIQAFALVAKQIPSSQLRIAGEITSESAYVNSVRALIQQEKLEERVHLLGALPEPSVFEEFTNCNILVLPSAQETAPLVISQAMAAGRPVVATRVGGVAEMVGETEERGLLVDVGDIERLADAMTRVLQDPKRQSRMGENGRAFARENNHPDSIARKTAEIYRVMLAKEQPVRV